jgi:hypothetical protein
MIKKAPIMSVLKTGVPFSFIREFSGGLFPPFVI